MTDEVLFHRGTILVRRQRLAPGESLPWHRDPCHRISVVLAGDALAIEYRDSDTSLVRETRTFGVEPGQVDWDEPSPRVHRAVNVGRQPYEEVTVFLLEHPEAAPQPREE